MQSIPIQSNYVNRLTYLWPFNDFACRMTNRVFCACASSDPSGDQQNNPEEQTNGGLNCIFKIFQNPDLFWKVFRSSVAKIFVFFSFVFFCIETNFIFLFNSLVTIDFRRKIQNFCSPNTLQILNAGYLLEINHLIKFRLMFYKLT